MSPHDLRQLSARHYRHESLRAMLMVFLSLDCIGKPYESITDLLGGLHSLLVAPILTLARRPARFPRHTLVGLLEALKALVRVLFNMTSKVLQAWAKGIAVLTLDTDFVSRRVQLVESRPAHHPIEGLSQGCLCLQRSLSSALLGLVVLTTAGFARRGWRGALAGVLRAALGLVFKPVVRPRT